MTNVPKWDEARTAQLVSYVGDESPVSIETVKGAAEHLETTDRSIAAKLRKMDYEVEKVGTTNTKTFTDKQEDFLVAFLEKNSGEYTFAEIAEVFADGEFSAKQIQGKVLSLEMTDHVKPAEKKVYERTFTDADQKTFVKMANAGAMLEEIAEKLNRSIASVRGKALSLLRSKEIDSIPASQKVAKSEDAFEGITVENLTVAELAEKVGRTERGVKTMLTRRGLVAKDYDGAAKKEKAAKVA
jgi:predicted transcriptional regulator